MYRLMLYVLICLVSFAVILSLFKVLPYHPVSIILSAVFLVGVCKIANTLMAKIFQTPVNCESAYITALILTLILTPIRSGQEVLPYLAAGVSAVAAKYILAIKRKHLFNPAACGAVLVGTLLNKGASWWVGNPGIVVFVLIGGLLIVRKIQKTGLVSGFILTALAVILASAGFRGNDLLLTAKNLILDTPILFFAFVMLTEPQTTPPKKIWQIVYGGLVGMLFASRLTPEVSLLAGNVFSYLVSPKEKLMLTLQTKTELAPGIYDFVFESDQSLNFLAGQYLEWTLGHKHPDSRGTRRYFTIASSPTERFLRIGVKFYPEGSSFKKSLLAQILGSKIVAGQLSGEFTLPKDPGKKLAFIAGGIGVTPYRSMIKYLVDTKEKRDIVLFYSSHLPADFVYTDVFAAARTLGVKTVYAATDKGQRVDENLLKKETPDYKNRIFYISGPHSMVDAFEKLLKDMRVPASCIKTDFFPGYA